MDDQSATVTSSDVDRIVTEHIGRFASALGVDYDPRPLYQGFKTVSVDDSWHHDRAVGLVRTARLAYQGETKVRSTLSKEERYADLFWLHDKEKDTQGFIAAFSDFSLLAFRGTETGRLSKAVKDIRTDFLITQRTVEYDGVNFGKVHKGFWDALESVWSQITSEKALDYLKAAPVWITGHSLGGALATIAATRLAKEQGITIGGLYTIGQPRVGNDKFADEAAKLIDRSRIFRMYESMDPVPKVPWSPTSLVSKLAPRVREKWQHVSGSQRCFISRKGHLLFLKEDPTRFERWIDALFGYWGVVLTLVLKKRIDVSAIASHHEAFNYLRAIGRAGPQDG